VNAMAERIDNETPIIATPFDEGIILNQLKKEQ